jgi:hypothetical protein
LIPYKKGEFFMTYYSNICADPSKPLVAEVGKCKVCSKEIYDNRLFVIHNNGFAHFSCYNELKKDDKGGQ